MSLRERMISAGAIVSAKSEQGLRRVGEGPCLPLDERAKVAAMEEIERFHRHGPDTRTVPRRGLGASRHTEPRPIAYSEEPL